VPLENQLKRQSLEWASLLRLYTSPYWELAVRVAQILLPSLLRRSPEGMFEVLSYDSTLELLDTKGEEAVFKRVQRMRFLQDNIIAIQDHVWGEGDIFASYDCSPGIEADRYQEGDRWNVLISLRETKSKGDVEDYYIERKVRNGFLNEWEWRQTELWHTTHYLDQREHSRKKVRLPLGEVVKIRLVYQRYCPDRTVGFCSNAPAGPIWRSLCVLKLCRVLHSFSKQAIMKVCFGGRRGRPGAVHKGERNVDLSMTLL